MRRAVLIVCAFSSFLLLAAFCSGDELPPRPPAADQRLDVSRAWSDSGGQIVSQRAIGETKVLHGLQVTVGANNWLKEMAVYNAGALEQRCQFYPNGRTFREQRREHNGDGDEVIYTPERDKPVAEKPARGGVDIGPIKTQDVICQGQIKAGKRWSGRFLVPVLDGFTTKLILQEYRDGRLVTSAPFPIVRLALPKEHTDFKGWLWDFPDWPMLRQQ